MMQKYFFQKNLYYAVAFGWSTSQVKSIYVCDYAIHTRNMLNILCNTNREWEKECWWLCVIIRKKAKRTSTLNNEEFFLYLRGRRMDRIAPVWNELWDESSWKRTKLYVFLSKIPFDELQLKITWNKLWFNQFDP